jgi:hypothetical protein
VSGEQELTPGRAAPLINPARLHGVGRGGWGWRVTWSLALLFAVSCLDRSTGTVRGSDPGALGAAQGENLLVIRIRGGPYDSHIHLVVISDRAHDAERELRPIASRAWDGTPVNDFAGFRGTPDDATALSWTLRDSSGHWLRLAYTFTGDTATGVLTLPDGTQYPMLGMRFSAAAVDLIAPPLPPASRDSVPAVVIRLDDVPGTDRDFLQRLKARGLVGEIAVPTRFVGQAGRLTWEELRAWRAEGMGIVMHSRHHRSGHASPQHFIDEIVDGFAEMKAHGFATHIFVQPGTWRDSMYFDSPLKLQSWRGALLRTFATVSECYAYDYWLQPTDDRALGLPHVSISDGATVAQIWGTWVVAQRPNHATVFLVHTANLKTPDQLDWFLDEVAAARARGAVRVVRTSEDFFSPSAQGNQEQPGDPTNPENRKQDEPSPGS